MSEPREFHVRLRDREGAGRVVVGASFEAAAVAFAEDHAADDVALVVLVREAASGREHCLRIDIAGGEVAACDADAA